MDVSINDRSISKSESTSFIQKHWPIVILFAAFINFLFLSGVLFSYNILYLDLKHTFNSTTTKAGIPGAISLSLFSFGSVIVTVLFQVLGHRITVALGVTSCCLGLLLSSFAQHITVLYITYGVMYGLGVNACNLTCTDMILRSFDKRNATRSTCTALCAVSIGILMSPCYEWLYQTYSWRVSFRILSVLLACIGYPSALVMVELKPMESNEEEETKKNKVKSKKINWKNYSFLFRRRGFKVCLLGYVFVSIAITFTFVSMGSFLSMNGMSVSSISFIILLMGITDLIGRIVTVYFSDKLPISRTFQNAVSAIIVAVPTLCNPFITSHKSFTAVFIAMSLPRAFLIVLMPTVAMELSTEATRAESTAAIYMAYGIGAITTPYITDAICDVTGSYDVPWYIGTALYAMTAVCMLLADRARKQNLKQDSKDYYPIENV